MGHQRALALMVAERAVRDRSYDFVTYEPGEWGVNAHDIARVYITLWEQDAVTRWQQDAAAIIARHQFGERAQQFADAVTAMLQAGVAKFTSIMEREDDEDDAR